MWISLELVHDNNRCIYIPKSIAAKMDHKVHVHFGKKSFIALVKPSKEYAAPMITHYDDPVKIRISTGLRDSLLIPTELAYQMRYCDKHILIGPVIGLLLGNHNHLYSPSHMEKYSDRLGIYEKVGGLICAFSSNTIDWDKKEVYGLYYNYNSKAWKYGKFPIPSAIYRRDFHSGLKDVKRLERLTKGRLYNSWRFTKPNLYHLIAEDSELSKHLPHTELCYDCEGIKRVIDKCERVILKPTSLSRGRGICIIFRENSCYKIYDYRLAEPVHNILRGDDELENFFEENKCFFHDYLIQQFLPLAKVDGAVFDIRVVMQKDRALKWNCSGIECRVANSKLKITNISRGGYPLTIDDALDKAFPDSSDNEFIKEQIDYLCKRLCICLERTGQHYAEFGMDIAVDEDKNLWFIEANVFPSFKGFKSMDYETYLKIRYAPILYGAYLAGF